VQFELIDFHDYCGWYDANPITSVCSVYFDVRLFLLTVANCLTVCGRKRKVHKGKITPLKQNLCAARQQGYIPLHRLRSSIEIAQFS
jgi:hypothetical protein